MPSEAKGSGRLASTKDGSENLQIKGFNPYQLSASPVLLPSPGAYSQN